MKNCKEFNSHYTNSSLGLIKFTPHYLPSSNSYKIGSFTALQLLSASFTPNETLYRLAPAGSVWLCPMHTHLHHPLLQLCVIYHADWVFCCGILPEPRRRKREKFSSDCSCFGCMHFCPVGLQSVLNVCWSTIKYPKFKRSCRRWRTSGICPERKTYLSKDSVCTFICFTILFLNKTLQLF